MRSRIGLFVKIAVSLSLVASLSGCWSRHEVDEISIVMAIGLDKLEQNDKVQYTAQVFNPKAQEEGGMGGGGDGGGDIYWNLTSTGDTVFSAVQEAVHKVPRELYFAHNQAVIFSRKIAQEGIQSYIDFFMREHQNRLTVSILIAKNKADEILELKPHLEDMPALDIADLIESQVEASQTSMVNLKHFATRLMSKTTAPVAPFIEVSGKGDKKNVRISGTAVFKNGKLIGQLNQSETRGLLWVIDEVKRGIVEVKCPGGGGNANLHIIRADRKIVPKVTDNRITMNIHINEEGILGSQSCPENLILPPKIAQLEARKADAIRNEIMAAVKKARKLNADIFGFGDAVHQRYPKLWKEFESNWDEIFPEIEIELTVKAKIRRSGRVTQPAVPVKE